MPIEYRFLCGHGIQSEDDIKALDYYIIGVWLVKHRKYKEWSEKKSLDLAEILEFMRMYGITIPRYIKRTKFYKVKRKELLIYFRVINTDDTKIEKEVVNNSDR